MDYKLLTYIITKCIETNHHNNNIRFKITNIIDSKYNIKVDPILPSEKIQLTYIFEETGYSIINLNNNSNNEIIIGSFSLLNPDCYYHWLINDFPRLYMCYNAGARIFITNRNIPNYKYINETLMLFKNKIKFININDLLSYSKYNIKIIYPYLPDEPRNNLYQNEFMKYFHIHRLTNYAKNIIPIHFNITLNKSPLYKVRIMRQDNREISNSYELNKFLYNIGFKIIILETLNIRAQLQLFSDTKIVIATHGSGIANCSVLSKESLLIEVCPKQYYIQKNITKVHFHLLSEIVGCKYKYFMTDINNNININLLKDYLSYNV